eukprot:CAMPEP_0198214450 /NCGR_PEP_ID=MMETSP1445-20131203/41583_1 /TAXON_ID=36898 /ORGANISM="Pyramimonas sp., Strain CCMP2087" /LENGTH=248 /DNA_ID=CAMNT_0043889663 /DNA_START=88 /DNA_END=834 /DNA_ORIENTATION=-
MGWQSLVVILLAIDMRALGDGEGDSISLLGRKWELGSLHTGSGDASEETLSLQDARVTAAAEFARKTWSEQSNSLEQYTTPRILSATTLTLEGGGYELDIELQGNMGTTQFAHVVVSEESADNKMRLESFHPLFTVHFAKDKDTDTPAGYGQTARMAGGFTPVQSLTADLRSAAVELARKKDDMEQGARLIVCKAAQQVVAGMNYKLTIGIGNCDHPFFGVVYRNLQGEYFAHLRPATAPAISHDFIG